MHDWLVISEVCAFSVIYLPISDENWISMNLVFATGDRNVTGAPGCPLAVTWISTRELMTSGQPRERRETEIMQTSS